MELTQIKDDPDGSDAKPDAAGQFLEALRLGMEQDTFVRLVLARYRGGEPDLKNTTVRPVVIKGGKYVSFVRHYETNDITENLPVEEGVKAIAGLLDVAYKSAHLLLSNEEFHMDYSRKGKCMLSRGVPSCAGAVPAVEHNREKHRVIDRRRPFLNALGITSVSGQVLPSMSHKWKQINKFVEFVDHAIAAAGLASGTAIKVVDFGCGKGYLTFAVHDFIRTTLGLDAEVTGVELRDNLVSFCNTTAEKLACSGLRFRKGDAGDYETAATDILIALHACDTATDLAIHAGVRAGAKIIMCAPCCHKQIRPQMRAPGVLKPILRFGSHMAQEADMVTDSLRALLLETQGYSVDVFDFVALEHTDKNRMIMGVKKAGACDPAQAWKQVNAIKDFYGIKEHRLESLLKPVN